MSKQRQRDRAAREAQQAVERQKRAKAAARQQRVERLTPAVPKRQPVYRQRRFPPLPGRLKLALALGWLVVAALVLYLVPTWTARVGFLVIAAFTVPLIVVLVRDPTRRTR
ncbi:MAG: hypothetical protein ACR2K2_04230 [Mycobacteriales bacterium]